MNPLDSGVAYVRDMQKFSAEMLANLGIRLATWLTLGNAGAAVLTFNAGIDGKVCNTALLNNITLSFAIGLMAAFLASAVTYFAGMYATTLLGRSMNGLVTVATNEYYIEKLEAENIELPDDAPLRTGIVAAGEQIEGAKTNMRRAWAVMVGAFFIYGVSALAFVNGILLPVVTTGGLDCVASQ